MSKAQYNLNTKTDYLQRKMFLDPAGPVTIQRFEEVKYKTHKTLKMLAMQSSTSLPATCYVKQH